MALGFSCFSGEYTWHKCCSSYSTLYFSDSAVKGNPACWSGDYNFDNCCPIRPGPGEDDLISDLPFRREPFVYFGLHDGTVLKPIQIVENLDASHSNLPPRLVGPSYVGGLLWPNAALLARWADEPLCAGPAAWNGLQVLELAAGIGLPSMVVQRYGGNVTPTDVSPLSMAALSDNVGPGRRFLDFLNINDDTVIKLKGTIDVILITNLLVSAPEDRNSLILNVIAALLKPCPGSQAVVLASARQLDAIMDWSRGHGVLSAAGSTSPVRLVGRASLRKYTADRDHELGILVRESQSASDQDGACPNVRLKVNKQCISYLNRYILEEV